MILRGRLIFVAIFISMKDVLTPTFKRLLQPPPPDFSDGQRRRAIIETCMGVLGKAEGRERARELFKTFRDDQKDQPGWELNATCAICCDDDVRPSPPILSPFLIILVERLALPLATGSDSRESPDVHGGVDIVLTSPKPCQVTARS
ncbi:hypothetical protein BDZ89DRAFT_1053071 [Hymenopellis radicata]|nr:hypothetical protein BDZ89DRAFT_1053071 [Hymenopellis radicata]